MTIDNGQWTMDNGQWTRLISFSLWTNGQWRMGSGQWELRMLTVLSFYY
ncbi:MAG: hypothetical protein LBB49_00060 [Gracilibacteraceae bacterium]|nr:hypothetical protein [Gracilibacteraceae bacterium]